MASNDNEINLEISSEVSTSCIKIDITPPAEIEVKFPISDEKVKKKVATENTENETKLPITAVKQNDFFNQNNCSISSQSIGTKSLNLTSTITESLCSVAVTSLTPAPSLVIPAASVTSLSPSPLLSTASVSSPQMATLSAPQPTVSSVYTANQPKTATLTQPNIMLLPTGSATGNPRNKVALRKGRGLMDWVRLGNTSTDLAGTGGKLLKVTAKELAKHNSRADAWMVIKGNVYNVTPYFEYHPGGEVELTRGIGQDATSLFNEVHKWVNYETMLSKCLVGHLVQGSSCLPLRSNCKTKSSRVDTTTLPPPTRLPPLPAPNQVTVPSFGTAGTTSSPKSSPSYDWYQSAQSVYVCVYTHMTSLTVRHCTVDLNSQALTIDIIIADQSYHIALELLKTVKQDFKVRVQVGGKVVVELSKVEEAGRWTRIGRTAKGNDTCGPLVDRQRVYHLCRLESKARLTHDTLLLGLKCPPHLYLPVPAGYHTYLRVTDTGLCKPYTAVPESLDVLLWSGYTEGHPGNILHYLVKVYSDGPMSTALDELSSGGGVEVTLAEGDHCPAVAEGTQSDGSPVTDVTLLAAGTGITPMIAVMMEAIVAKRRVRLIFFNKTEQDIPWRRELDDLTAKHEDLVQVHHVLSRSDEGWVGLRGHVSRELLDPLLPVGDGDRAVLLAVCGPRLYVTATVDVFGELGYLKEEYHVFDG